MNDLSLGDMLVIGFLDDRLAQSRSLQLGDRILFFVPYDIGDGCFAVLYLHNAAAAADY